MNRKQIILEMSVEDEDIVFANEPVASVSSTTVLNLEGDTLRKYVYNSISSKQIPPVYKLGEHEIGAIISHHCSYRKLRKAALLTIPDVINSGYIISPWRKKLVNGNPSRKPSGMIGAPILIDGVKYLCCLTIKRDSNGTIEPYAITLKDKDGNVVEEEKMNATISSVHDDNNEPTTNGNAHFDKVVTSHDSNSSFQNTKIQQNISNVKKRNIGTTPNLYGADEITESKYTKKMKKNVIKLNENQLRQIVAESVKIVLKESSKERLLSQIYEYVDEHGKEASGGKVVFFRRGATDNEGNELIYLWIDENGELTLCSNLDGHEHCNYLSHYQDSEILSIFNMLRGYEQYSTPSESTLQKVYDLYHYLDSSAYKESDATRELRDIIGDWINHNNSDY